MLSTEAVVYPVQLGMEGPLSYLRLAVVRRTRDDDRMAHGGLVMMTAWPTVLHWLDHRR